MIQRRKFIGSMAALFVASGSRFAFANTPMANPIPVPINPLVGDLSWECQTIETIPHNDAQRPPVVTGVSLQKTGDLLAIVGDDHFVCLYDTRRQMYVEHLDQHKDWVRSAQFSPDGTKLVTAGNDRTLCIWNVNNWNQPAITKRHSEAIIHTAFSNDGSKIATVGFDSWLRVYDVNSGSQLNKLACPCPDNHAVAFSSDDSMLAAGGRCGTIRVWDMRTNLKAAEFKAHRQRIRTIEFSSSDRVVSAGDDQTVRITNPNDVADTTSLPRNSSKFYATALLGGGLIATGGSDNLIHIWQLNEANLLGSLRGHTGTVTSLAFSGSQLVSGSYDTHVRIWSTERHTSSTGQRHTELRNGWNQKLK